MKKKIATIAAVIAIVLAGVFAPVPTVSAAPEDQDICTKYKNADGNPNYEMICGKSKNESDAQEVVKNVLSTVFTWLGIISVIVIIVGGVFYLTSQGEPDKIKRAKNAILYALIGLIVSLLAFAIVNFVLTAMQ